MTEIGPNNQPDFIHQTLAEHFAARFFVDNLIAKKSQKAFRKFVIDRLLCDAELVVVRSFFNHSLLNSKNSPNSKITSGLSEYGQEMTNCQDLMRLNDEGRLAFNQSVQESNTCILKFLYYSLEICYERKWWGDQSTACFNELILSRDINCKTPLQIAAEGERDAPAESIGEILKIAQENMKPDLLRVFLSPGEYYSLLYSKKVSDKASGLILDFMSTNSEQVDWKVLIAPNSNNQTPLHIAVYTGRETVVELLELIENKLQIESINFDKLMGKDYKGRSPLHIDGRIRDDSVVEHLIDFVQRNSDRFDLRRLIGPQVDERGFVRDSDWGTPFHCIVLREKGVVDKFLSVVQTNIDRIDINVLFERQKRMKLTPLKVASENKREEIMCRIFAFVQDNIDRVDCSLVFQPDNRGYNPFHSMGIFGMVQATECALSLIEDPFDKFDIGSLFECCDRETPLDVALKNGHDEVARKMLEFLIRNSRSFQGKRLLHFAYDRQDERIIHLISDLYKK